MQKRNNSPKKNKSASKPRKEGSGKPYLGNKPLKQKISVKTKQRIERAKDDNTIRLNKFIASTGLCSRREAD